MVVVNKPGASGGLCLEYVVNSKPDGYTIVDHSFTNLVMQPFLSLCNIYIPRLYFYRRPYWIKSSFLVRKDAPWKDFRDWVEYAKKNPGTKFGTHGPAVSQHIIMVWITKHENLKVILATFKGDADTLPALMGGHIDMGMSVGSHVPLVEGGKLRTLLQLAGEPADTTKVQSLEEVYPDLPNSLKLLKESQMGLLAKGYLLPLYKK